MTPPEINIAVIEYGIGNIGSVLHACRRAGYQPKTVSDGESLLSEKFDRIVLPGVGAIGEALALVRERGLDTALEQCVIRDKTPFLGICVGMQFLAETCEEYGEHVGLGWFPGRVKRLDPHKVGYKLPHIGWNDIDVSGDDILFSNLQDRHFYFVHSLAMDCPEEYVTARCYYGGSFVCAVRRDNITAVQFHPEKSSANGLALMKAFVEG